MFVFGDVNDVLRLEPVVFSPHQLKQITVQGQPSNAPSVFRHNHHRRHQYHLRFHLCRRHHHHQQTLTMALSPITSKVSLDVLRSAVLPTATSLLLSSLRGGSVRVPSAAADDLSAHESPLAERDSNRTAPIAPIRETGVNGINERITNAGGTNVDNINVTNDLKHRITPRARAVLCMAVGMALHYLGYSFARPSTIALFTSATTGYAGSAAAFPLAMAFISPVSLGLLMMYSRALHRYGPRGALTATTFLCSGVLSLSAFLILALEKSGATLWSIPAVKLVSGPLFVFRESYVQLLTSQYWSFMSSVMTPSQSARWFAPISGLTSIASALAGMNVSKVVTAIGLPGALLTTASMMLLSLVATRSAYGIAQRHGFDPSQKSDRKKSGSGTTTSPSQPSADNHSVHQDDKAPKEKPNMFQKATVLFKRVPTLGALFQEILIAQGLATVLNVIFVSKLSTTIPNDGDRAGWMGKFFAYINICSMAIQFAVLPKLMTIIEARALWRALPIVMMVLTTFQACQSDPSLYLVSASLLAMKTLEYSARRMLDEMVYVPLDFESRYLGKEVIGVFGYRLGKSSMSLVLSGLTAVFGSIGLQPLSIVTSGTSIAWFVSALRLSRLIPTKEQAEQVYKEAREK